VRAACATFSLVLGICTGRIALAQDVDSLGRSERQRAFADLVSEERPRSERIAAIENVRRSPESALEVIHVLADLLADPDEEVARSAGATLTALGKPAWPGLAMAGTFGSEPERDRALAKFLAGLGDEIVPDLIDVTMASRGDGANALALRAFGARAVPRLVPLLKNARCPAAAHALGLLGKDARDALPALRVAHGAWTGRDRAHISLAIARITGDRGEWRTMLLTSLDEAHGFGHEVLDDVAAAGPGIAEAAPRLRKLLAETMDHPAFVARALWRVEGDAAEVLPALIRVLGASSVSRRHFLDDNYAARACIEVLKEMGPAARPASGMLLELLATSPLIPKQDVDALLQSTGIEPALVPRLRVWLTTGTATAVRTALYALRHVGPAALDAMPNMIAILARDDDELCRRCGYVFSQPRMPAAAVADSLANALGKAKGALARRIIEEIGKLGPGASCAVPALRMACAERGEALVAVVLRACARIGPLALAALPEALKALEGDDDAAREEAIAALRAFGRGARSAEARLMAALRTPASAKGLDAARALVAIRGAEAAATVEPYAGACLARPELQLDALWALADLGTHARAHAEAARPLLRAEDPCLRAAAACLLAACGEDVPQSLGVLGEAISSGNAAALHSGCAAAERLGAVARPLESTLRGLIETRKLGTDERAAIDRALAAIAAER